jgi:hypothetical protein
VKASQIGSLKAKKKAELSGVRGKELSKVFKRARKA